MSMYIISLHALCSCIILLDYYKFALSWNIMNNNLCLSPSVYRYSEISLNILVRNNIIWRCDSKSQVYARNMCQNNNLDRWVRVINWLIIKCVSHYSFRQQAYTRGEYYNLILFIIVIILCSWHHESRYRITISVIKKK